LNSHNKKLNRYWRSIEGSVFAVEDTNEHENGVRIIYLRNMTSGNQDITLSRLIQEAYEIRDESVIDSQIIESCGHYTEYTYELSVVFMGCRVPKSQEEDEGY
jgi:hypothetical protein